MPRAYERSFRWKLSQFRYLCSSNALPSHIKITVTRQTLFEDSYHQIMRLPAYELRRRLYIIFVSIVFISYFEINEWLYKLLTHNYLFEFRYSAVRRVWTTVACHVNGSSCYRTRCSIRCTAFSNMQTKTTTACRSIRPAT